MIPTGIIFATLDCDADSIEEWNRWYDLEHTPPNLWLPGVMLSRRYVAPPELHEVRIATPESGFADGLISFITIYTLCGPPIETVTGMSTLRDKLYAEGRMNFPPEKKVVRPGGGVMNYVSGVSSPALQLPSEEVPFVGHTGMLAVRRKSDEAVSTWYRTEWAQRVAALQGVHGVASFDVSHIPGEQLEIVYFEGDPVERTEMIRSAAPHSSAGEVLADAPYLLINYLEQPWADSMRASWLPKTVGA